jgi:putative DNA primase/helicase
MTDQQTPVVVSPVWDSVPAALATRQQWLLWKFEHKEGAAKPGKIPYYVAGGRRTGGQGDDRDRQRLATLDVVRRAYARGGWSGVGFAFLPGDGLIGIDIDGAIDPETGVVSDRCAAIIKACNSFTEYSPSGKGVHIIVEGHTTTNKSNDIGLEVFCERQFFTFTANRYPDTPADVQAIDAGVLSRLHKTIDDAKEASKAARKEAQAPAQPASKAPTPTRPTPAAQPEPSGVDDFKRVNEVALAALQVWVPSLFPLATPYRSGFRITSKQLNRSNQEDLSMQPDGIVDWGLEGTGDPKDGRRTPIDLVMEWLPAAKPVDAMKWLAQRVGIELSPPPQRAKQKNANGQAPAGGGDNAPPPGSGEVPPSAGDDDEVDVYAHLVKNRGRPLDCRENVMYCLQLDPDLKGLVKQNDFTHLLERSRTTPWGHEAGEWNEEDDLMLGEFMLRKHGLGIKATSTLRNGVLMAARSAKYNPVLDLIHAEKWDGIPRLEHWISDVYEVEERPYTRLIGKCFIMGLVKRALQPGCKFDYMLIIKGEQGLKKSTAFRALAYPFFTDNAIRMGDKDSLMAMQLVWIAESAELESLNKSETTQIKQFLSAQEDMFRPPYGSQLIRAKRHSVNVGTTNADEFLKDATGDRRFWPLEVHQVNEDTLSGMRLQLFAEALHLLEKGERYWPTKEEERDLVFPEQAPFKRTDTWEDIIDAYVNRDTPDRHDDPNAPVNAKRDFFPRSEIYERALLIKADRIDGSGNMDTRIGNAMKQLGFDKHRETSGKRRRGFMRRPPPPPPATPQAAPVSPVAAPVDYETYPASEDYDLPL